MSGLSRVKLTLNWLALPQDVARIQERLPNVDVSFLPADSLARKSTQPVGVEASKLIDLVREATVLLAYGEIPSKVVLDAHALRFISSMEGGCDELPFDALRAKGIQVANAHGVWDQVVAEQAMMFLLAFAKRLATDHQAVVEARWQPTWAETGLSISLEGETVCVVGVGGIGEQIARLSKAFGMRVIGVRRQSGNLNNVLDEVYTPDRLLEALGGARFVVLSAPLTPETRGFIDEQALRGMRADAFLINVARAALVDEDALHDALVSQQIAGFASDVWWDYGLTYFGVPSRSGIHRLPNVLGSGDRSNNIEGGWSRTLSSGLDNVAAYLAGQPPRHLVDLERGY